MCTTEPMRRQVILAHRNGLHIRPINALVKEASQFTAEIKVLFDGRIADARSAMELMVLGATFGSQLTLEAIGADSDAALSAISAILEAETG